MRLLKLALEIIKDKGYISKLWLEMIFVPCSLPNNPVTQQLLAFHGYGKSPSQTGGLVVHLLEKDYHLLRKPECTTELAMASPIPGSWWWRHKKHLPPGKIFNFTCNRFSLDKSITWINLATVAEGRMLQTNGKTICGIAAVTVSAGNHEKSNTMNTPSTTQEL